MPKPKSTRGGVRKGAGRPRTVGRGKSVRLSDAAAEWLDGYAARHALTLREVVDRATLALDIAEREMR